MDTWNGTGDQYVLDTESRYPLFSDIQTTDYSISPKKLNMNKTKNPIKEKFTSTIKSCNCINCKHKNNPPIEKLTNPYESVNQRMKQLQMEHDSFQPNLGFDSVNLDNNTIIIMFMFLVIVFVCCFFNNAISELKSQIKSLKQIIKNKV